MQLTGILNRTTIKLEFQQNKMNPRFPNEHNLDTPIFNCSSAPAFGSRNLSNYNQALYTPAAGWSIGCWFAFAQNFSSEPRIIRRCAMTSSVGHMTPAQV